MKKILGMMCIGLLSLTLLGCNKQDNANSMQQQNLNVTQEEKLDDSTTVARLLQDTIKSNPKTKLDFQTLCPKEDRCEIQYEIKEEEDNYIITFSTKENTTDTMKYRRNPLTNIIEYYFWSGFYGKVYHLENGKLEKIKNHGL